MVLYFTPSQGVDWESCSQSDMHNTTLTTNPTIRYGSGAPTIVTHSSSFDEHYKVQSGEHPSGTLDAREFTLSKDTG